MTLLDRLDRIVRPFAVSHLTETLVIGQVIALIMCVVDSTLAERLPLVWNQVFQGEIWRLATFVFFPPTFHILVIFYFMLLMLMGRALEQHWGTVRFNTYVYLGIVLTLLVSLCFRDHLVTGVFIQATLFLAFATVYPNYELLIMLILPVKVKWLALLQLIGYVLVILGGDLATTLMLVASLGNYVVFFSGHWIQFGNRAKRQSAQKSIRKRERKLAGEPRHRCNVCGIDSKSHPFEDFRYCSKCDGERAFCEEHLHDHEHQVGAGLTSGDQ